MILSNADLDAVDQELDKDPVGKHVISVIGEPSEWKIGCPWALAAAALMDGTLSSGWPIPACAVVSPCDECGRAHHDGGNGVRALVHGTDHALINGRLLLLETMTCGLALDLDSARDEGGWLARIRYEHGEGVYTVDPAVTATGALVGINPFHLVEVER